MIKVSIHYEMFLLNTAKASQAINVNGQDSFGRTPLHYAALYGRLQTAEVCVISSHV